MSYLDQINNIQNSLFSYQQQLQGEQDSLAAQAQELLNEKVQNVAEKLEFIGTAGMAGIETLGKVKDLATKGVKIYQKGKQVVQEGQEALTNLSERAQGVVGDLRAGAQRVIAGAQQAAENLGIGERTAGLTSRLSAGVENVAGQVQAGIEGATTQAQTAIGGAVAQAESAVGSAAQRVEGAVSGIQGQLQGGLEQATGLARGGLEQATGLARGGVQQLQELGTQAQQTVRSATQQLSEGLPELPDLPGLSDLPRITPSSLTADLPMPSGVSFSLADAGETALTRVLPEGLDIANTAVGRFTAGILAQRPEIQAAIRTTQAQGSGSTIRIGDAINDFIERTAPQTRARIGTASNPPTQPSAAQQNIARQAQAEFETDPEAAAGRLTTDLNTIPTIGNLEQGTATRALSGGANVVGGSTTTGTVGVTTETVGTTGTLTTAGTTTTTTGSTVAATTDTVAAGTTAGTAGTAGTTAGTAAGGSLAELGEGIGSLIGDAIPVVGELAMLGTALAGIFESIFKHPVETFSPQIISAVGYDPSSLTSTFTGEGGTV